MYFFMRSCSHIGIGVQAVHDAEERDSVQVRRDLLFGGPDLDVGGILEGPESLDGCPGPPPEVPLGSLVELEGLEVPAVGCLRPDLSGQFPGPFDSAFRGRIATQQLQYPVGEGAQKGRFTWWVGELLDVSEPPATRALAVCAGR